MGAGGLFSWLVRVVLGYLSVGHLRFLGHWGMIWHLLGTLVMFAGWLACRSGLRSAGFVRVTEAVCVIGSCLCYCAMGFYMEPMSAPEDTILLIFAITLLARSIYVPSTAQRTIGFGVVLGLLLLSMTFCIHRFGNDPSIYRPDYHGSKATPETMAIFSVIAAGAWWLLITALSASASSVIHGLRKTVHDISKLGQYVLEEKIGEGGMGVVYRASHAMLRRPTAVKLLLPEKAGADNVARFEREVQLTARLYHPNTVTVFDDGRTPDGVFYYAMELLDGANLDDIVARDGPQPTARVIRILEGVAGSLAEAHAIGLIHRDIKPANIMLCEQGGIPDVAKVLDFGLVRQLDDNIHETQPGQISGTPMFMAPESIDDPDHIDAGVDIYALGALAYYLLTGKPVFSGKSLVELFKKHLDAEPVPPSERLGRPILPELERLVLQCLSKRRRDRPSTAGEVLERLQAMDCPEEWDGAAWWQSHRDRLRRRRAGGSLAGPARTITVDLAAHPGLASSRAPDGESPGPIASGHRDSDRSE